MPTINTNNKLPRREFAGYDSRFCLKPFRTRWGTIVIMVHDASYVTDQDIRDGIGSPCVNQFDTMDEAKAWCIEVEEKKIETIPHEAWQRQAYPRK